VDGEFFGRFKGGRGNYNSIDFSPHYPLSGMKFLKSFFDGKFIYPVLAASLDLGYWGDIVNSTLNVKCFLPESVSFPKVI
jgi:hypothetical protein